MQKLSRISRLPKLAPVQPPPFTPSTPGTDTAIDTLAGCMLDVDRMPLAFQLRACGQSVTHIAGGLPIGFQSAIKMYIRMMFVYSNI